MSDERILAVLRMQAWQRAKAELESVLDTYYSEYREEITPENPTGKTPNGFDVLGPLFAAFITQVENEI